MEQKSLRNTGLDVACRNGFALTKRNQVIVQTKQNTDLHGVK